MRRQCLGLVMVLLVGGCATTPPKYQCNWNQVQVGMTKDQVGKLLGDSSVKVGPTEFKAQSGSDSLGELLGAWVFDLQYERWDYGEGGLDYILAPSPKAYVVYFDREGQVVKFRGPVLSTQPANGKRDRFDDSG